MWVSYKADYGIKVASFVCIEHPQDSYAYALAKKWWKAHSTYPFPHTVDEAVKCLREGKIGIPKQLMVTRQKDNPKYFRIVSELGLVLNKNPIMENPCKECIYYTEGECLVQNPSVGKEKCEQYTYDF
jgi:hypothetical protein